MSEKTKQLLCDKCGAVVSSPVPIDLIVRGWIECPECIERAPDVDNLRAENERLTAEIEHLNAEIAGRIERDGP